MEDTWDGMSDRRRRPQTPDMTGMIIQALAPYYWDDTEYTYDNVKTGEFRTVTVRQVVDEALDALGELQTEYGDYICYGDRNVESTVQVLVAITSLGIDPLTDERFIKNGNTLIDGIQSFSLSGGGYEHMLGAAGITWRLTRGTMVW